MNDLSQALAEATLKVNWAKSHVVQLVREIGAIPDDDLAKIVVEDDLKTGKQGAKIVEILNFPPSIPLITGDVVHNIRTAFDYLFVAITGDKEMAMPVGKMRHDIETKSGQYGTIKKRWPNLADFLLNKIQPYEGGQFLLWESSALDRIDKHRFIIPYRGAATRLGVKFEDEHGNRIAPIWMSVDPRIPRPFGREIKIKSEGHAIADICFGPRTPLEGKPIVGTLFDACEGAVAALAEFRGFFGIQD